MIKFKYSIRIEMVAAGYDEIAGNMLTVTNALLQGQKDGQLRDRDDVLMDFHVSVMPNDPKLSHAGHKPGGASKTDHEKSNS
jgi:hypothetical protein